MKRISFFLGVGIAVAFIFSFFGCNDTGLGGAVDTERPDVAITYPDYDVVIRESFYVVGNCSDDKLIKSVKVWISNTRNESICAGPFEATLSSHDTSKGRDDRTWYVELNPPKTDGGGYNGWTLPDGNYAVKAIAYDAAGRESSEASHTYIIDNTPPYMRIKSPGVNAVDSVSAIGNSGKTPTPYGANFKIEGLIIENNDVRTMKVDVFQKAGKTEIETGNLHSVLTKEQSDALVFHNINIAGSTSETIANARKKISGTEEEIALSAKLFENYVAIYGEDPNKKSGTENLYCQVTLTDGAKIYQDKKGQAVIEEGNSTSDVYINDIINNDLMTEVSGYKLSDKQIAQILNDTYQIDNSEGTAYTTEEKEAIKNKAKNALAKYTAFSLNPDANPRFNVSGFATASDAIDLTKPLLEINEEAKEKVPMAMANQTLNVTVTAGRDNYYIKPETLTYYLFGPYETYSKVVEEIEEIYYGEGGPAAYYAKAGNPYAVPDEKDVDRTNPDEDKFYNARKNHYNSSTVESYNWEVKLPSKVKASEFYVVAISGQDEEALELYPKDNNFYVIQGSNNIQAPKITFEETNGSCYGTTNITFHGTAKSEFGIEIEDVFWTATLTNPDDDTDKITVVPDAGKTGKKILDMTPVDPSDPNGASFVNWVLPLKEAWNDPAVNFTGKTYSLEITVWAKDAGGKESPFLSKSFDIDTTSPTFANSDFSIDVAGNPNYVGPSDLQYQDGEYTLRGYVSDDKSGVIAFYYKVVDGLDASISLPPINRPSDGTLLTSAPDVDVATYGDWKKITDIAKFHKDGELIDGIGNFNQKTIALFALDKAGNRSALYKYSIVFDSNTPVAKITTPVDGYTKEMQSVVAEVTGRNLKSLSLYDDNATGDKEIATWVVGGTTNTLTVTPDQNDDSKNTVTYNFTPTDGTTYKFRLVAKNMAESLGSSDIIEVMFDETAPVIESSTLKVEGKNVAGNYFNAKSLSIDGKYKEDGSGIKCIKYTIVPPDNSPSIENEFSATNGEISTVIAGFKPGKNVFTMTPVDKAGNEGNPVSLNIEVDMKLPSVSGIKRSSGGFESEVSNELLTNAVSPVTITGYAFDDIDIESVKLLIGVDVIASVDSTNTVGFVDKTSELTQAEKDTGYNKKIKWTITIPKAVLQEKDPADPTKNKVDGGQISVEVEDKATNSVGQPICRLQVDTEPPKYEVSTPTVDLNGTSDIQGKASDNKTLASIEMYYARALEIENAPGKAYETVETTESKTPADYGWTRVEKDSDNPSSDYVYTKTSEIYNWKFLNFPFDLATSGAPSDGANAGIADMYFLAVVKDEAGNSNAYTVDDSGKTTWNFKAAANKFTVDLNADKPLVKFENIASDLSLKYEKDASVRGTVTDDDSESGKVVKELIMSCEKISATTGFTKDENQSTVLGTGCIIWSRAVGSGTEKTIFNPKTGKWKFMPADASDGSKDVYIYVRDNNDTVFYSGHSESLYLPRVQFNDQDITDPLVKTQANDKITYNSDRETPQVDSVQIATSSTTGFSPVWETGNISSETKVGGTVKRYIRFKIIAKDANGIKDLRFTFTDAKTKEVKTATFSTATQKGVQEKIDGGKDSVWITDEIDLKGIGSGNTEVIVIPTDNSEMDGTSRYTFYVDNEIPLDEFWITAPASTVRQTGTVKITGTATDGGGAGIVQNGITWAIPKYNQDPKTVRIEDLTWRGVNTSSELPQWEFIFDNDADNAIIDTSKNPMLKLYITDEYFNDITKYDGMFNIPLLFKIEDALGNFDVYRTYTVRYEPDATMPTTAVAYPLSKDSLGNQTKVGQNIRIMGSTSCILPLEKAYVQLAIVENESQEPNWNWVSDPAARSEMQKLLVALIDSDGLTSKITMKSGLGSNVSNDPNTNTGKHIFVMEPNWWGIEASGNTTWNLTVNTQGLENLNQKYLCIRACSIVDERNEGASNPSYFVGPWSEVQKVAIDSGAPTVGRIIKLVTFPVGSTANQISNGDVEPTDYSDVTMELTTYVSEKIGNLYLAVSAEDETGIGDVTVSKIYMSNASEAVTDFATRTQRISGSVYAHANNKWIYIPIDMTNDGRYTYSISAKETGTQSPLIGYGSRVIYVDNTPPILSDTKGGANLLSDAVGVENKIVDSNRGFSISGDMKEPGSGFERLLFYFYRGSELVSDVNKQVYLDPIWTDSFSSKADSKVALKDLNTVTVSQGSDTFTMYGKRLTGTQPKDAGEPIKNQFSATGLSSNIHIKAGGLIYIEGKILRIRSISGNVVTFEGETTSGNATEATFIYGQVVDNMSTSEDTTDSINPVFKIDYDDGDGMPEKINIMSNSYSWSADMHTTNLPDGPATIVILAFDKSGNVSQQKFNTFISNSPPRLAKIHLGTDLNKSNSFSKEEFETYNFLGVEGIDQDNFDLTTNKYKVAALDKDGIWRTSDSNRKSFKIKKQLALVPEFTGGNGEVKAALKNNSGTETKVLGTAADSFITRTASSPFASGSENDMYVFENNVLGGNTAVDSNDNPIPRKMSFTFWDSTDELVCGENSQYAFLRVMDFIVNTEDKTKPNAVINKFFWKSATENSLYKNSKANGHIELEGDVNAAMRSEYGDTVGNEKPKVSGKITLRGTSYDDTCLGSLWIHFDSFTPRNYIAGETLTVGTTTFYKAAVYNNSAATWTVADAKMESDDWEFNVISDTEKGAYFGQDGHKVLWELSIDTSKITNVAELNRIASVIAVDLEGNTPENLTASTTDTSDEKYHKPSYAMDVVPYVTGMNTLIANNAGDEFARSALGKYSVYENESVIINGFNLTGTTLTAKLNGSSITPTIKAGTTSLNLPIGTATTSGKLDLSINGIVVLNNINNNPIFGTDGQTIKQNEHNSLANGVNNNRLNDDLEFYIWNMGYFLNSTNITSPMMKMDAEGNYYMSYGDGVPIMRLNNNGTKRQVDYSYNKFHNTAVGFDSSGNIYGLGTNTDRINNSSAKFVFYTENTGSVTGDTAYTSSSSYKRHLEQVYNSKTGVYDINRVKMPKMAITGAGTSANPAKVYISYFDSNNTISPVKFRYGTVADKTTITGGITGNTINSTVPGESNNPNTTDSSAAGYHIVASNNTTYKGGAYTAVGATSTGVAVVAWYDASSRQLVYSYNENPETPVVGGVWQTNAIVIDPNYAGWYVDMIVDGSDGIHIAYYNSSKGDLKYAYLSSYSDTDPKVVTVDSYLSAGTYLTINAKLENGKYVPYISYFHSSFTQTPSSVRIAWLSDTDNLRDGATSDKFTGAWECMTVPTQNIPTDSTICSGVPTSGTYSKTPVLGYMSDTGYEKAYIKYQ